MKKSLIVILGLSTTIYGAEFQFGNGTFTMEGGFLGATASMDNDIATFSLIDRHTNIASGQFFYAYDLNWYDSKDLIQAQKNYNNMASQLSIPSMKYRVKGLDINIKAGYDVIHQDRDNFLGVGVLVGASFPWIDSSKNATPNLDFFLDNSDSMLDAGDLYKDSETDIMTYKIGPTINFQKTLIGNKLSAYGSLSYAYQTGTISNDYIRSDLDVDGTYQEYGFGLYFTPFTETFKWGWLTLSPRIFATIGYKYSKWSVEDVAIDISGQKMTSKALEPFETTFDMSSSVGYFGVGYSF